MKLHVDPQILKEQSPTFWPIHIIPAMLIKSRDNCSYEWDGVLNKHSASCFCFIYSIFIMQNGLFALLFRAAPVDECSAMRERMRTFF